MAKRILLIDYEPRSVERLQGLLSADHQLAVAKDGEEGLATFSSEPRFDLILLAGMLPRLASGEVIREIRRKGGATAPPILLMVSGYKGSNPKADAQRVGAFDLLVKPFSDEDLRSSVRSALESTDIGSRTVRIPMVAAAPATAEITASVIFSDVWKDITAEPAAPAKPAPAPPPPPRAPAAPPSAPAPAKPAAASSVDAEIDRRLRDTLSEMLGPRETVRTGPSSPAAAEKAAAAGKKFSTEADIDRMLSDTLSGLSVPPKKSPPGKTPLPLSARPPASLSPAATRTPPPSTRLGATPPPASAAPAPSAPAAPRPEPRAAEPQPSPSPDRFGQYEILERIASGGMAELYRARRRGVEGFEKIVAIKKILPHLADNEGFITMFADE